MTRFRTSLLLLAALFLVAFALQLGTPAPAAAAIPPFDDFILCSCKLCKAEPYTICQISPSGYSILCADWYRLHC